MTEFEVFAKAIRLIGEVREWFLETACTSNADLPDRIHALIQKHDESGGLLPRYSHRDTDQTMHTAIGLMVGTPLER